MPLTFITSNTNKAAQLSQWLAHPIEHLALDLDEIQTTDLTELVTHKARQAYAQIHQPVLVEDTAVNFNAFGNLPGPFIKFFLQELELEQICRLLDPFADRSATIIAVYGLCQDGDQVEIFRGESTGTIPQHPIGDGGFGWNPIFIPDGSTKSFAQMTTEEVKPFNHRAKATEKLAAYLKQSPLSAHRQI